MRRVALLSALLAPFLPGVAFGQATPERAAALQAEITDWFRSILAVPTDGGSGSVTVTPAGDHYELRWRPVADTDGPVLTGKLTDAGAGRWAIDDLTMPSPSVFRFRLPASSATSSTKPGAAKPGPARPNAARPGTAKPGGSKSDTPGASAANPASAGTDVTSTVTVATQQQHALIDPSFASPWTMSSVIGDMDLTTLFPGTTQLTHVDSVKSDGTVRPASDNRLDISSTAELGGYSAKISAENGRPFAFAINKGTLATTMTGVSRERGADLLRLLAKVNRAAREAAATGQTKMAPMPREDLLTLVSAFAGLMKSGSMQQQFDDISVTTSGLTGSLKRLAIGLSSEADGEKLRARIPMAAEGLTLPDLDLGAMGKLIPTRLVLTPNVSGVPSAPLMAMVQKSIENQGPTDADIEALFASGPLNAGIDDFALDVAGSSFAGHVGMLISSPAVFSGTGQITADNIDRLQQTIAANPENANFVPVIIFLKGIGRAEQGRLVWDIAYRDGQLLVNGQDMAALTGPPAAPARRR